MKEPAKNIPTPVIQKQPSVFFNTSGKDSFFKPDIQKKAEEKDLSSKNLQTKLDVGQPGDVYEKEADQVADKVSRKEAVGSNDINRFQTGLSARFESDIERKEEDKETVIQAKPDDYEKLQKKGENSGISEGFESKLNSSQGQGNPLDSKTQSEMGSGFGHDFSDVRVHTDSNAVQMSRDIGAQAFTHGNDIFFNEGKFNPGSSEGKHLLAHELTHTVQQGGGVQNKKMQMATGGNAPDTEKPDIPDKADSYDLTTDPPRINIPEVQIPAFKKKVSPDDKTYFRANNYGREEENDPAQADKWDKGTKPDGLKTKLIAPPYSLRSDRVYLIRVKGEEKFQRIGDAESLAQGLKVPFWKKDSKFEPHQIDHKIELQIAGWPRNEAQWAKEIDNLQLLNASANMASGRDIKSSISKAIQEQLTKNDELKKAVESKGIKLGKVNENTVNDVKSRFDIYYKKVSGGLKDPSDANVWIAGDVNSGLPLDNLKTGSGGKIVLYDLKNPAGGGAFDKHNYGDHAESILGSSESFRIYTGTFGGRSLAIKWPAAGPTWRNRTTQDPTIWGFDYTQIQFNYKPEDKANPYVGSLKGTPFKVKGKGAEKQYLFLDEEFTWNVKRVPNTDYAGYLDKEDLKKWINDKGLKFKPLSPATINAINIDPESGIIATGSIMPSIPLIKDTGVELYVKGDDIGIRKVFNKGNIKIPSPFIINNCSLIIGFGTNTGLNIEGRIDFGINHVGQGFIKASDSVKGSFALEGEFNFDSKLFDPAKIKVAYINNEFSIGGTLGVKEGKVKGIKSATINAAYANNTFTAEGTAEPAIKGVKEVTLKISMTSEEFMIEGGVKIDKLPCIKEGEGTLKIVKKGNEYDFSGSGKVIPDIPGINTQIDFDFQNNIFNVHASVAYQRDRLAGSINVGITNRAIGTDGNPTGEPLNDYKVYGGGSLTLKITERLQITASVNLLENGEIEVTGKLVLPDRFKLFPAPLPLKEKDIIDFPTIHIPIFAIPLGIANVGIEATISPYIKGAAEIGEGCLTNVFAEVKYNPSHPEQMTITGGTDFEMRVYAALTVGVDFDIGLSVGIASLSGGIGVSASLVLEAKQPLLHAEIKWSPATGFDFQGLAQAIIVPKLVFGGNFHLKASALFWDKTWRWPIFDTEFNPGLEFGLKLPFHYQEGQPFNLDFSSIEFVYPKFDSNTIDKLTDKVVRPIKEKF